MFVTGNQFVFVYTRDVCHKDVQTAVGRLYRGEDLCELWRHVYTEIEDIPSLWYEIDLPTPCIYGLSKIDYTSPTNYKEFDIEELFAEKMIEHYMQQYCDAEYIHEALPQFCRDTEAYEDFRLSLEDAEQLKKEQDSIRAWYQACCLH